MNFFSATFTFNSLPNSDLSLNGRLNRWERAKLVKQERTHGYYLGCQHRMSWETPKVAAIGYEFYVTTKHIRDYENLIGACKPWVDGLVDSGILVKDDCWHLEIGYARIFLTSREETRLIITDKGVK